MITWAERLANLRKAMGREPTIEEALDVASIHEMTKAEIEAQRQSLTARCEHGELDFEQCPDCR